MQILIADDDLTSRRVLGRTLGTLGYEVLEASDGAEAWARVAAARPPVVITDWMMPRMDGLELCRRIRSDAGPDGYTYLVVLTQRDGRTDYLEAMDAGADDVLTKPFDPDELVARLRVAERILGMQAALGYLTALVECCPGCRRVRQANGRWVGLRQVAAGAPRAPASRCPECLRSESAGRARGPGRGAA